MKGKTTNLEREEARISLQAVQSMIDYRLRHTPRNFAVMQAWAHGEEEISEAIESLLRRHKRLTNADCSNLYFRFLAGTESSLYPEILPQFENLLNATSAQVREAIEGQSEFGGEISRISRGATKMTPPELKGVLQELSQSTQAALERSRRIEGELKAASREVDHLQQVVAKIEREASTDALTGVANRRALDQRLELEVEQSYMTDAPLSLVMLDIDHFKQFNDQWGHAVGDSVLKLVGRVLIENIRGRDLAARFGGEEFALILPETTIDNAVLVADKIRRVLPSKRLRSRDGGGDFGVVHISAGAAQLLEGETAFDLLHRADKALYAAKHAGRNRVMRADAD